jgi:hypothetical protein
MAIVTLILGSAGQLRADNLVLGGAKSISGFSSWLNEVQSKIVGTGLMSGAVDVFNASSTTPSLATLQNYDSVLVFSDNGSFDNTVLLGNTLSDYVDLGYGVVVMTFANASIPLSGRWISGAYDPILPKSQSQGTELFLGTIYDHNHPVLANVNSFSGGTNSFHGTGSLNPNATLIADWTNGRPLIAELDTFAGRVLSLNFYPPSSDSRADFWDATTDGAILMANALNYTAIPEPATVILLGFGALSLIRKK